MGFYYNPTNEVELKGEKVTSDFTQEMMVTEATRGYLFVMHVTRHDAPFNNAPIVSSWNEYMEFKRQEKRGLVTVDGVYKFDANKLVAFCNPISLLNGIIERHVTDSILNNLPD